MVRTKSVWSPIDGKTDGLGTLTSATSEEACEPATG
jgi:hypothetical protein